MKGGGRRKKGEGKRVEKWTIDEELEIKNRDFWKEDLREGLWERRVRFDVRKRNEGFMSQTDLDY